MKKLILVLGMTCALLPACGSQSSDHKAENPPLPPTAFTLSAQQTWSLKIIWNHPPVSQSFDNSADIYFLDKNGQDVTSSQLTRMRLYMTSMGHPSIKEQDMVLTQVAPGHWTVSRIYFSMGGSSGAWVVDVEAVVNGQADKARVSVDYDVE